MWGLETKNTGINKVILKKEKSGDELCYDSPPRNHDKRVDVVGRRYEKVDDRACM